MELLLIAYLRDNELCVIGGWYWLEQRLMWSEVAQRENHKREAESDQLNCLSVLGITT